MIDDEQDPNGPGDPRLKRLRHSLQQRPDLRLQKVKQTVAAMQAVTPAQRATSEAVFGEIPASSGGRDFFQTPEVTPLTPDQQPPYKRWLAQNQATDVDNPDAHYDYPGAFAAGVNRDASGHLPDTFKQHGHPTFSVESKYSAGPQDGGHWEGEKYTPQSPRIRGAREMATTPPEGGFGSYAKQALVAAAGGLGRFGATVGIQTARDLARGGKTALALAKAAGSGAAPPGAIDQAMEQATSETGGGGYPFVPAIPAAPRWQGAGNQVQSGTGAAAGRQVGSIYERAQQGADEAITGAENAIAGKPDFTGQVGREEGEFVGGLLPLAPAGIRAGAGLVERILAGAGKGRKASMLARASSLMEPPPPEPTPIGSDAQPVLPPETAPTTPLRTMADVQKDLAGAQQATLEATQRGIPRLAQEYQRHVNKLLAEVKKMSGPPPEPPAGGPPEPPPAGSPVLKVAPERRGTQTAATPELGLYNRGAAEQMGKTPAEMEQILHPSKGLPEGVSAPAQRASVERITNQAMDQSAVDELVGEQTAKPFGQGEPIPPRPKGLQGMELDQLEKEFVKLDNMPRRNPTQELRHKTIEKELDRRDKLNTAPVEPISPPLLGVQHAKTGKPFRAELLRGQGRGSSPYAEGIDFPLLGEGRYTTPSREYAEHFGGDVTPHEVKLKNPLVIQDDDQWRALTREAGWEYSNPISLDPAKRALTMPPLIKRLREVIERKGHDGVVVKMDPRGDMAKTLRTLFGADQAVEFKPASRPIRNVPPGVTQTPDGDFLVPPPEEPPAGPSGSAPKKPKGPEPTTPGWGFQKTGEKHGDMNKPGKTVKGDQITWDGTWEGKQLRLRSEVRKGNTGDHFMTSSNARIKGDAAAKLPDYVDIQVDGALTDDELQRFAQHAQQFDTRPVRVRRKGETLAQGVHAHGDAYEPEPPPEPTPPTNPKFKKLDNNALLARRHQVIDRMDAMNQIANDERTAWTRYDDDISEQRSGTSMTGKGGRAMGRAKDDARIVSEITAELNARGLTDRQINQAHETYRTEKAKAEQAERDKPITWPDGTVFSFPGPIKARTAAGAVLGAAVAVNGPLKTEKPMTLEDKINVGIVGAVVGALSAKLGSKIVEAIKVGMLSDDAWVAEALIKHSKLSDADLRKVEGALDGQRAEAAAAGIKPEDFDAVDRMWREAIRDLGEKPAPPEKPNVTLPTGVWKFPKEKGGATLGTAATLAGAGVGAVTGASASDKENRVGGALTGALAGAFVGHILARATASQAGRAAFQKTVNDPDVAAVLSAAAGPRKGVIRTFAGVRAAIVDHARSSYQALIDDVYGARRFGREVGNTEKVSDEASRARGWRGFGDELIGRTERWRQQFSLFSHLPTLRKAVQLSKGHEAEVVALSWAERAIELENAGMDWKLFGHATRAQAEATVRKLSAIPEARAGADALRAFYDYLYDLRHKNGLISDAEYAATKAKHQQYVSFLRDFGNEEGVNAGSAGGKLYMRGSTVKKMEPGIASAPIVDPFEQAAADAYRVARAVSRQRVFNAITEIIAQNPQGAAPWIKDFGVGTTGIPKGYEGRTIQARVKGELHLYGIENYDFYNALSAITPETHDIAHFLLTLPKKTLQAGTTIVPSFGAANASRDAFFTSLSYKFPARAALAGAAAGAGIGAYESPDDPARGAAIGAGLGLSAGVMGVHAGRIVRAFSSIVKNDDLYQLWKRSGGQGSGMFVKSREDAEKAIAALRHDHVTPLDLVNPKTWWEALENLNRMIEEAPRLAKFNDELYRQKKGVASSVATSRNVSLDFSRHGGSDLARIGRDVTAFWNPKLQGVDKMAQVFRKPGTYAMGVTAMTAPTVALWMINKDDPEYQRRPLYEKMLVWHIPVGKDERGVTKYFLLPKPFEPGYVFASLPQLLLDFAYQHDKERTMAGLAQVGGNVIEGMLPIPTAFQPVLENQAGPQGWSRFRGRPIVDDALSKLPPREQVDARTSTAAVALSRAAELGTFGLYSPSPKKVDNVLQGWFGQGGRVASSGIEDLLHRTGLSDRPVPPARNTSQWSRFVSQAAGFNTDDIQTLFRQYEDAAQHLEQVKRLVREGRIPQAQAYAKAHDADIVTARMYAKAIEKYRKIAAGRRAIENSRTLTADEKRDQIAALGEQASELAKTYVDARLKLTQGTK